MPARGTAVDHSTVEIQSKESLNPPIVFLVVIGTVPRVANRILPFRIPDSGSKRHRIPEPEIRNIEVKKRSIFFPKTCYKSF
jgi:hypothetical protein